MTVWHMRTACWIPKATNTNTICNNYCFPTATMVTRTCINVTLYVRCLSCNYCTQFAVLYSKEGLSTCFIAEIKDTHPRQLPPSLVCYLQDMYRVIVSSRTCSERKFKRCACLINAHPVLLMRYLQRLYF